MTHFPAVAIFLLGSTLSAWLRFDKGALLASWIVMLVCIAGVMVTWLPEARRAPPLVFPREVQELGARDQLSPDEKQRFGDALRAHHRQTQREVWRDLQRQGPGALIGPRAAFYYFWLCVFVLAVLPPTAVPSDVLPRLPRFVLVLTSLALAAIAVAAPLGLRDWRRVVRSLEDSTDAGRAQSLRRALQVNASVRPDTPAMTFAFRFTSTHRDLLDGFDAYRTARTGMRAWARAGLIALGFMWLAGTILVFVTDVKPRRFWQPAVWLVLALFLLWQYLLKPSLTKRQLQASNAASQEVALTFSDSGIDVEAVGVGQFHRSWDEVTRVIPAPKGIALGLIGGEGHWLPSRVFESAQQRTAFIEFLRSRLLQTSGHDAA